MQFKNLADLSAHRHIRIQRAQGILEHHRETFTAQAVQILLALPEELLPIQPDAATDRRVIR